MSDDLFGNIVIEEHVVKFSDKVGKYATPEQVSVLYRTADRLGKAAWNDRYPSDEFMAQFYRPPYYSSKCRRNKYDVPEDMVFKSVYNQFKELGKL